MSGPNNEGVSHEHASIAGHYGRGCDRHFRVRAIVPHHLEHESADAASAGFQHDPAAIEHDVDPVDDLFRQRSAGQPVVELRSDPGTGFQPEQIGRAHV